MVFAVGITEIGKHPLNQLRDFCPNPKTLPPLPKGKATHSYRLAKVVVSSLVVLNVAPLTQRVHAKEKMPAEKDLRSLRAKLQASVVTLHLAKAKHTRIPMA